ncbi:MAG: hypothetical protein EOP84_24900 [Verrucomicrobiaceae bacterium]|nr:MAG: hypothetical protein EOP84_24900 [Verrucomicrobiaceae bacterium]
MNTTHEIPRWGTYKQASKHSGLSVRHLQNLVREDLIRSSVVTKPGAKRGVRLLDLRSLDEFIEAGVGRPPMELAMNLHRQKVQCISSGDWWFPEQLRDGLCPDCLKAPLEFDPPTP